MSMITYIGNGKIVSPIGCHVGLIHNYDVSVMMFMALDRVYKDPGGGDFDKGFLQWKTRWIQRLKDFLLFKVIILVL